MNPYVAPVLYVRRPGSDHEETHQFSEDDPFFSEVSVLIDNIEDIEEDPETAQILSSFEGMSCASNTIFLTLLPLQMRPRPTSSLGRSAKPQNGPAPSASPHKPKALFASVIQEHRTCKMRVGMCVYDIMDGRKI